jgi:CheY-like chemotaxis protein
MVDFFKIESGKLTLEDVTFDLRTTIDEVIACFPAQTVANVPQLLCLFSYDVPLPLRGDPGRLRQILVNLIGNAFKATTQGEIVVRCALAHATPTHATFRFSVTSADMDISSLIESPSLPSFSLTGLSTLREVDRAGLILAMSKKLVQLMGGEIGAKNDPGEGSTIWFTVTFEKQPPQALLHTSARADLRGLRALIAGKDPELIAPLQQQMHEWGMRSRSTETLQAALQALTTAASTEESYDIVVFVCQALQKEVLDLVRTIRTTVALTTLRLVTLVAVGQRGDARQARQVGLDAYLTTPVPQTQLFECLTTVMSHPPWTARTPHAPLVTRHTLAEEKTRRRPRILVATESTTDQKSAVRLLARLGYRADVVSHGQEIVEALTHVPYAVVLIDHQMSMMDGVEVTFWIRKQDQQEGAHTSILGLVPKGKNDEAGQCFQAGMDDVLFKPLNPEELKAVLDRTLQQSSKSLQPLLTSQSSLPICDQAEALAGVNGDQSLLGEIAGLFLQEYPQFLAAIRKALVQQHAQTLTYAAQTLRSALSNFAAAAATAAALQLENIGRQGDLSQAPAAVAQLEEELSRLHPALASLQQEEIAA